MNIIDKAEIAAKAILALNETGGKLYARIVAESERVLSAEGANADACARGLLKTLGLDDE